MQEKRRVNHVVLMRTRIGNVDEQGNKEQKEKGEIQKKMRRGNVDGKKMGKCRREEQIGRCSRRTKMQK